MQRDQLSRAIVEMNIGVGHDAEFFLCNRDGKFISSIGIVPGTKESPFKTPHGWVQQDNVAGEINIPVSRSVKDFIEFTSGALNDLRTIIKPLNLEVAIIPSAEYDEDQLEHPDAKEAGCSTDMNAYTLKDNPTVNLSDTNLRSAGGHIHLSWDNVERSYFDRTNVATNGDFFITLPSLLIDKDIRRRSLYGKAGAHRRKEYGVELRSPSNFWAQNRKLMEWVYWQAIASVAYMDRAETFPNVQEVIDNNNVEEAERIVKEYKIILPEVA